LHVVKASTQLPTFGRENGDELPEWRAGMSSKSIAMLYCSMLVLLSWTIAAAQNRRATKKVTVIPTASEAPANLDGKSNGMVDDPTHQADQAKFDEVEAIADGLGPLYNAQSCRECHQNPESGGGSQITELRVGHLGPNRRFLTPNIPIAHGAQIISGRTLVNDRATCPNAAFPDTEIQERVPNSESVRTTRISLSLLGDGFVEALADQTLIDLSRNQCKSSYGKICGLVVYVPIVEAPGQAGIGRFGWKDQHASLLSFSGDAYLNEMGITTQLFPEEVTTLCNTVSEPNDKPGTDGLADVDHFARFVRALKAPPRDQKLGDTPSAKSGAELFHKVGCTVCHVQTLTTSAAGTKIDGGAFTVPPALGNKTFHPYSDFLLHDVGTGDGIVIPTVEHYGRAAGRMPNQCSPENFQRTQNRVRTAPLWGVRFRTRLMHDGVSMTLHDAILRHSGEADDSARRFRKLAAKDQEAIMDFIRSL
jgi:CxxC motif-containing protein (DUF1111 family)